MTFDPEEMARRGRIGAFRLHSKYDSKELTRPARAAFDRRFEIEVDPEGALPPEERSRRARLARKAHFAKLARLSAIARSKQGKKSATVSAVAEGEEER